MFQTVNVKCGERSLRKSKDGISKAMYRQADAIASRMEHLEKVEGVKEEDAIVMDVQALDLPKENGCC